MVSHSWLLRFQILHLDKIVPINKATLIDYPLIEVLLTKFPLQFQHAQKILES